MRVGLVGCVKSKATHSMPAKDLSTSSLFRGRRRFVEGSCNRWFILSAKHGLVDPEATLDPYDLELKRLRAPERRAWSQQVLSQLEARVGELGRHEFEVHAGADYLSNGVVEGFQARGASVSNPAGHRTLGQLLSFYNQGSDSTRPKELDVQSPKSANITAANGGFARLGDWLSAQPQSMLTISFKQIDEVTGKKLPPSASKHRAYWANSMANARARDWLNAGWRVASVDGTSGVVRFERSR
jgi:hypothetical protein